MKEDNCQADYCHVRPYKYSTEFFKYQLNFSNTLTAISTHVYNKTI